MRSDRHNISGLGGAGLFDAKNRLEELLESFFHSGCFASTRLGSWPHDDRARWCEQSSVLHKGRVRVVLVSRQNGDGQPALLQGLDVGGMLMHRQSVVGCAEMGGGKATGQGTAR